MGQGRCKSTSMGDKQLSCMHCRIPQHPSTSHRLPSPGCVEQARNVVRDAPGRTGNRRWEGSCCRAAKVSW